MMPRALVSRQQKDAAGRRAQIPVAVLSLALALPPLLILADGKKMRCRMAWNWPILDDQWCQTIMAKDCAFDEMPADC
jgi:hypothetical protein